MSKQRLQLSKQTQEKFNRVRRLEELQNMDPIEFEQFSGYLLAQQGYQVWTTVASGDEGIDLFLQQGTKTAVVQCKRYSGTVGQPVVRDLYGAMIHAEANEAMLVTTGVISQPAETWAKGKPIRLIDGHELMSWMRRQRRDVPALAAPRPPINWKPLALLGLVIVCFGIIGWAGWLAWQTLSSRTGGQLPVLPTPITTPIAAATTAPEATETAVPELAPTATLPSPLNSPIEVARVSRPPIVDGDLNEWAGFTTITTPYITEQESTWDGSMDVDANWRLGWDDENLYFGIHIKDDVHVQTKEAKFGYLGDSLELQFDTDLRGDFAPRVNRDDFQYILSPGNFVDIPPGVFRFQGDDQGLLSDALGSRARAMAIKVSDGYQIEAIIPWSDMGITPQPGLTIGAALSTNDNDTPGTAKQELMLSHVSTRLWRDPTSWGTLTLK